MENHLAIQFQECRLRFNFNMFIKITALVALALAAQTSALPTVQVGSWDEIVGASRGLFGPQINSVRSKSFETAAILAELNVLLGNDQVLDFVYGKYLTSYSKPTTRFYSPASKALFKQALLEIAEHNLEAAKGKFTWTEGVNQFTDMSREESARYRNGQKGAAAKYFAAANITQTSAPKPNVDLSYSDEIDWRGQTTPVKNQGQCGSCFAFAMVGALEANYIINGGAEMDLAEQQIVDCSRDNGDGGCNGGNGYAAAEYLKDGIASEADYPYTAVEGTCQDVAPAGPVVLSSEHGDNEDALYAALGNGPVDVSVDADCKAFERYTSGVLQDCGQDLDHDVLAVGWSPNNEAPHWLIKNSWGEDWGDQGYIRIGSGSNYAGIGTDFYSITTN